MAALFYSWLESAQMNGLNPAEHLRIAVEAALDGRPVPLPHELAAQAVAA